MSETDKTVPPVEVKKPSAYARRRLRKADEAIEQQVRVISRFGELGLKAGCPKDQVANFIKAGIFLFPKQIQASACARECDKLDGPTRIGFGGPRGPGKSFWQFAQMLADDMQRFPGLKFLIIRKTQKAIREQLRDVLGRVCGVGDNKRIPYEYKEQKGVIELPNGSYAVVGHFKDEKDLDHYLGQEYDGLLIEEANTLTHTKTENIFTCLRTSKQGWRPRAYLSWNWGGIGHPHLMNTFYKPWEEGRQTDTRYVLATVHDNPAINPEYIETLKKLTGWKYKSWYLGDPHFQAGQFFTNWDESWHVFPNKHVTLIPNEPASWFGSLDYGFAHPTSFHLHCNDKLGNTYTVGRVHKSQAVIEEIVQDVLALLKSFRLEPGELDFIAAGRDCFSRKQDGRTIAMDYEDCGIDLTPSEIDRVNGWAVMQQRLGDPARNIAPTWFIHKSCVELIEQIPLAQNHETRVGDIEKMNADDNGEGGDDAIECLSGDTLITTLTGRKFLKNIMPGDVVLTSCGLRIVTEWKMSSPSCPVLELKMEDGSLLRGTFEHLVWVKDLGWTPIDCVRNGDIVFACQKLSNSMASSSAVILSQRGVTSVVTFGQAAIIAIGELERFIRRFGNRFMDRFQRDITFITKMEIPWTMHHQISNANLDSTIYQNTEKASQSSNPGAGWITPEHSHSFGITDRKQKRLQKIIGQKRLGSYLSGKHSNVPSAENPFGEKHQTTCLNFVHSLARERLKGETAETIFSESVKTAERRSQHSNTSAPKLVPLRVVRVSSSNPEAVYDISVDSCPDFFADGILVHNSARNGIVAEKGGVIKFARATALARHPYQMIGCG